MEKYFITGSSYFIDKTITKFLPKNDNVDIEIFFGDELNKADFFSFINSISIYSDYKIAILRNFSKLKDKNIEYFIDNVSKSSESIILITSEIKDKTEKNVIDIFTKYNFKIIKEDIKKQATREDVTAIFKEKNILLNSGQADIILGKCFNNLSMVANEAEKMELYILSQNNKVSVSELIEQISGEKEETIFALSDSFGLRNIHQTLKIYTTLEQDTDKNFQVFFALSKRIYNLYYILIDETLLDKIHPFQLSKIKEQSEKWSIKDIVQILDILSELDKNIKTGTITVNNAILTLILSIGK